MIDIDLRCMDVQALVSGLPDASCDLVVADPPWSYDDGHGYGKVAKHYEMLALSDIAEHIAAASRVARPDTYLVVWATFPTLQDWMGHYATIKAAGWLYLTGGAWRKEDRRIGAGHHFRGDTELLLVYRKGKPQPRLMLSNDFVSPRRLHSEKPQAALRLLTEWATASGGLVLDLYAGESASMARACRATGRRYVGAEIDPARHARALNRLALEEQATMELTA